MTMKVKKGREKTREVSERIETRECMKGKYNE